MVRAARDLQPILIGSNGLWWYSADLALNRLVTLVILVLLFAIGVKKFGGMWWTAQPWMSQMPPPNAVPQFGWQPSQQQPNNQYPHPNGQPEMYYVQKP
jgi:hypothetical protein